MGVLLNEEDRFAGDPVEGDSDGPSFMDIALEQIQVEADALTLLADR